MAFFWMFSLAPEAITALLPIALFPLLKIISTKEVCILYTEVSYPGESQAASPRLIAKFAIRSGQQSVMMMLSSLILAKAIEESKIHQRLALKMLFHIGTSVHKVLFGLMMTTMFLSFCISSSAATAMVSACSMNTVHTV